jgi:hypothetical protein
MELGEQMLPQRHRINLEETGELRSALRSLSEALEAVLITDLPIERKQLAILQATEVFADLLDDEAMEEEGLTSRTSCPAEGL